MYLTTTVMSLIPTRNRHHAQCPNSVRERPYSFSASATLMSAACETLLGDVSHGVARQLSPTVIVRSPVPALPPSGGATTPCPWPDTSRSPSRVPCGPAPTGQSWHTGCPGHGGSGPGAGACPVLRPRRGPGGSGLRPTRLAADDAGPRPRPGVAGRRLRCPVPDEHGRTPARAAPGYTPRPGGQRGDTPRPARSHRPTGGTLRA